MGSYQLFLKHREVKTALSEASGESRIDEVVIQNALLWDVRNTIQGKNAPSAHGDLI